jgi:hypothetical protein
VAGKCQTTSSCNTVGAPCCPGSICQGGLQCAENGTCRAPPTCGALQGDCSSSSQCCTGLQCLLTVQPDPGPAKKTCCVGEGASCPNGDLDCCGYLLCNAGKCACQDTGGDCLQNSDCCSRMCDSSSGTCVAGSTMCTGGQPLGSSCTDPSQCCGAATCATLSSTGDLTCCYVANQGCTTSRDCCGKMLCDPTTHACQCRTTGQSCLLDIDCCGSTSFCNGGTCS